MLQNKNIKINLQFLYNTCIQYRNYLGMYKCFCVVFIIIVIFGYNDHDDNSII